MDLSQSLNLNTATENPLFDPTYLNLEYLFNQILEFFRGIFGPGSSSGLSSTVSFFKILLFVLAVFFIFIIIYCFVRLLEIRKKEREHLKHEIAEYTRKKAEQEKAFGEENGIKNVRWYNVLHYLSSPNSSDWKLAIIEADSMLEDLTNQLEFEGENLGERLKTVDRERFQTLNDAWEAHVVRNRIAHEGSSFELSQHEANRIIVLYENVFREFGYI